MKKLINILMLTTIVSLSCGTKEDSMSVTKTIGTAEILFEVDSISAGSKIKKIDVAANSFEGIENLKLLVSNKWGIKVIASPIKNEIASFSLSEVRFEESGEVEFIVVAEAEVLDRHKLKVLPLRGDSLIESYLGPKTIIVGGKEKTMLTNITTDKYGNPISDGSLVNYSVRFPMEQAYTVGVKTDHLVSFVQLRSKDITGKIIIGANSSDASIREQEVRVTPGFAQNISIELIEWFPYADSRQTVWLKSSVIKDDHGNVVADGTMVSYVVKDGVDIINEYKSYTVGGISNVFIENPKVESNWKVIAKTDDENKSNILELNFQSNIENMAFDYNKGEHSISVGPITSELGQYINDGTEVSLTIKKGGEEIKLEKEALDGYCEFKLRGKKFVQGTYALALEVGGERRTKNLVVR